MPAPAEQRLRDERAAEIAFLRLEQARNAAAIERARRFLGMLADQLADAAGSRSTFGPRGVAERRDLGRGRENG